jgi:integrating conjugative element protein (TIGR03752 family)
VGGSGNKLTPILGAIAVAFLLVVLLRPGKDEPQPELGPLKAPSPDIDSPADTVRSLSVKLAEMQRESEALRRENQDLLKQRPEIASQVRAELTEEIKRQREQDAQDLARKFEELSKRLSPAAQSSAAAQKLPPFPPLRPVGQAPGELPLGLGQFAPALASDKVWVEPLDAAGGVGGKIKTLQRSPDSLAASRGSDAGPSSASSAPETKIRLPEPAYTVPRNSTLVGSTAMTALIGRVPVRGQIEDPFPFKVIVGRDNLAANGLQMPGVNGMVFSGTAFGDWTLACVRGKVSSVTYVFDDGTVRTVSSANNQGAGTSASSTGAAGGVGGIGMGWISDRRGIPCLSGRRISNAIDYLSGRLLARGVEAAGKAFSRAQTTVNNTPLGGVTSSVTGNAANYALGETVAGGADELARWISDRQSQMFDVVYVDTGAEVAVHIDQELTIDYEPNGRKLDYARAAALSRHPGGLD